ncbi:MAG: protein translocase subunit SecF [Rhodocyclaceae bacterium]|nr:protein translocase subunit SecF [Rhodocyclaceae bacterium]
MINFFKFRFIYFGISTIVILSGLISIFTFGFRTSIDFSGGTILEYQTGKQTDMKRLDSLLQSQKFKVLLQEQKGNKLSMRFAPLSVADEKVVLEQVKKASKSSVTILRSETVGATLGKETINKTLIAALVAILGILLYMTFAFKSFNFAVAAIVALAHDLLVMVGGYSIISHFYGAELNTLFVTALLTTLSFSVHDTIIIFDKIREYRRSRVEDVQISANRALTETLIRSLNNSMTIMFMLLALILFGGSTIRFFIIALLIGTITGTYSSPFIATPMLVLLEKRKR